MKRTIDVKRGARLAHGAWLATGAVTMVIAGCGGKSGGSAGSSSSTVATVGGQAISREELQGLAEVKAGPQALSELIDSNLIFADAKTKGIEVTDQDVQAELDKRVKEDPAMGKQLSEVRTQGGVQKTALERQVRLRLTLDRVLAKDIKASDAEIKAWFDKNKDKLYAPKVKVGMLLTSQKPRSETMERQLKSNAKTFKELVDEQQKITDEAARSSSMESPTMPLDQAVPPNLRSAILKLKVGQTTPVVTLTAGPGRPSVYALVRLVERLDTTFETARPQIEADYKLEQLARREAKKTAPNQPFEQVVQQQQSQIMQQAMMSGQMSGMPSTQDVWNALIRNAQQTLITDLRQKSKVEITDPFYATMKSSYGAAPITPAGAPGAPGAPAPPGGAAPSGAPAGAPAAPPSAPGAAR